jgi:hypothetical protein
MAQNRFFNEFSKYSLNISKIEFTKRFSKYLLKA